MKGMSHVEINIHLFGKPSWELDLENCDFNKKLVKAIHDKGLELKDRLSQVAEDCEKLLNNGWEGSGGLYDIMLYKPCNSLASFNDRKQEIKKLKLKGAYNIKEISDE